MASKIGRCICLEVLAAYGAPEQVRFCCLADALVFAGGLPSIPWQRARAKRRGGACCALFWFRAELGRDR